VADALVLLTWESIVLTDVWWCANREIGVPGAVPEMEKNLRINPHSQEWLCYQPDEAFALVIELHPQRRNSFESERVPGAGHVADHKTSPSVNAIDSIEFACQRFRAIRTDGRPRANQSNGLP
jgi:hypothetical protein